MRVLFLGDIVGRPGRKQALRVLPQLKKLLGVDFAVINGENAAHGHGLTLKIYRQLLEAGADVVTMGNHTFSNAEIVEALDQEPYLLRPLNYPENTVGRGFCVKTTVDGARVGVLQLLGEAFMKQPCESPFTTEEAFRKGHPLGRDFDLLVIDFHAEATAEKVRFAYQADGYAALVAGTHTHIPTADARILPQGTGYITDVGMCGNYDSVIGMTLESTCARYLNKEGQVRLEPAEGEATCCGVVADINVKNGKTERIFPVRIGPHLENTPALDIQA